MFDVDRYADGVGAGDRADWRDELDALLERPEWHERAACRGKGWDAWFPERGQSHEPAKTVCAACPVTAECLRAALEDRDGTHGVWAGTSYRQRRKMPRR